MQIILKKDAVLLGLKKYFTGKPCKQGHISERYTTKSTCIECLKISSINRHEQKKECDRKRYHSLTDEQRIKERERLRIHAAKMYKKNPEEKRRLAREWRDAHKEESIVRTAKWRIENRERHLESRRNQYANNPEKYRKFRTDYYARNIYLEKSRSAVYRSRNMVFYSRVNKERLHRIKIATPNWANLEIIDSIYKNRPDGMHVDHIIPLKSNLVCGLHCESNMQYLPVAENIRKGNRTWPDMP